MGEESRPRGHRAELVAGPPWAPAIDDLARLRAVTGKSRAVIHSEVRGASMGAAIPDGARIRIRCGPESTGAAAKVIAFLAGSRIMVHRIVYEGRRGPRAQFVLTQGDGNWLCDPPVNRATVVGEVEAFSTGGEWQPIGAPRIAVASAAGGPPIAAPDAARARMEPGLRHLALPSDQLAAHGAAPGPLAVAAITAPAMCGISAILRLDGDAADDLADLDRMHRAQRHRGPDGEGAFTIDRQFEGRRCERVPARGDGAGRRSFAWSRRCGGCGYPTCGRLPISRWSPPISAAG